MIKQTCKIKPVPLYVYVDFPHTTTPDCLGHLRTIYPFIDCVCLSQRSSQGAEQANSSPLTVSSHDPSPRRIQDCDHFCKWYYVVGTVCGLPSCPRTQQPTRFRSWQPDEVCLLRQLVLWVAFSFPYSCGELPGMTGLHRPNPVHTSPGACPFPLESTVDARCLVACQLLAPSSGPGLISGQSCKHGRSHPAGSPGAPQPAG